MSSNKVPLSVRIRNSLLIKPSASLHRSLMSLTRGKIPALEHKYGHIQTGSTCWFNSIINPFLESKYGRKLLLKKLRAYYDSLTVPHKLAFMNTKILGTTKRFRFFKFVYAYWTRQIHSRQTGRNRNLVLNMNKNNGYYKMCMGAWPMREIHKILKTIGITDNEVYVDHMSGESVMNIMNSNDQVLDSCILHMSGGRWSHAICGVITPEGKYMLIDSNGGNFECDWRRMITLFPCLRKRYPQIKDVSYDSVIYVRTANLPRMFSTNLLKANSA